MHPAEDHGKAAATTSHSDALQQFKKEVRKTQSKIKLQKEFEWAKCDYQAEIHANTKEPLRPPGLSAILCKFQFAVFPQHWRLTLPFHPLFSSLPTNL